MDCLIEIEEPLTTDVSPDVSYVPSTVFLDQNLPNPFERTTSFSFGLPRADLAKLWIYSVDGRLVRRLVDDNLNPGIHHAVWDGLSEAGKPVAPGMYLARLDVGGFKI